MSKRINPSAIHSRSLIIEALLRLMKKKQYTKITITELANEAQIVRKTFYHHFYVLDDVLDAYVEMLYMEYIAELKVADIKNVYEHLPLYFRFWQKHFDFLKILERNDLLIFILKKYDSLLPLLHPLLPCSLTEEGPLFEYYTAYVSGAFWKLLCQWVQRDGQESPEQMAEIFTTFLTALATPHLPTCPKK